MGLYEDYPLSPLDQKARSVYGERVVLKSLAQQIQFQRLPRYVSEYLIAKYVQPESWLDDLERIRNKLRDHLPEVDKREWLKHELLRRGQLVLIDSVEVRVDLKTGQRWATVKALGDNRVNVLETLLDAHPGLLLGGLWGTAEIVYRPDVNSEAPNHLINFTPFQVHVHDRRPYLEGRKEFSTDEWIELMLSSCGYNPAAFPDRRTRLLLLCRLIPMVEPNVNLIELGPRQTGKTFLLRNLSPRVFTISGGRTSPANLFYNLARRTVGLIGTYKAIVFDEIASTTFDEQEATVSILKDYMESGNFSRGNLSFASDASIVMCGNIEVQDNRPADKYRHLLAVLPDELIDAALIDRIHGYLPGWEIPKLTPQSFATGVGFVTDYFGEILVQLRQEDFRQLIRQLGFYADMTQRDRVAVERLANGLIKILYPDGRLTDAELREVVQLACELRQRVHDQLCVLAPGEFHPRRIGYLGMEDQPASDLQCDRDGIRPEDRLNNQAVVGAITGLVVLFDDGGKPRGGGLVIIEVSANPASSPALEITGLHGDVLRDSVRTAYHVVEANLSRLHVEPGRFRQTKVIVHLVRIAEPREGPSVGLAFVLGIVSALTRRPVKPALAVTGEVSLHGEVLQVGGLSFKVHAAVQAGRRRILISAENAAEVSRLPETVLAQAEIIPVRTVFEALELALEKEAVPIEANQPASPV